jgi:capsular polysaccharide transport system permease protein
LGGYYTVFIETKKYQSTGIITVKNLSQEQSISALGSILTSVNSGTTQDSKVLELYIRSYDMYQILDREFNLTKYYTSNTIDFPRRLYKNSNFPYLMASQENLLGRYNDDLSIYYDQLSSTIEISYLHADTKTAKQIVDNIIQQSIKTLNKFEHENAHIALEFLETQAKKNKKRFIDAIKKIIIYQNKHSTVDPKSDIQLESALLANLQGELIKQEVAYSSQLVRKRSNTPSMQSLKKSINEMKHKIHMIKNKISGDTNKNTLNVNAFDFEILKNEADLTKELYKQTLIKLEETKISVKQKAKNITIISVPIISDMYTSPDIPNKILSLLIVLTFLYGILYLSIMIIKSHKD